jgi:cell division septation protein DedD
MASREKKNGGDFVLESRHLVGLFMLLVVIFGIVFTLGYLLGRSQYDSHLRAAIGKPADEDPPAAAPVPKSKGKPESTGAGSPPAAAPPKPVTPPKTSAPAGTPLVAKGAIMLQVAAVLREGDAMALAQALQQKKFPAFVITPGTDKYYRVQVGPYADAQSATNARHDLEANGFKSIVKR